MHALVSQDKVAEHLRLVLSLLYEDVLSVALASL